MLRIPQFRVKVTESVKGAWQTSTIIKTWPSAVYVAIPRWLESVQIATSPYGSGSYFGEFWKKEIDSDVYHCGICRKRCSTTIVVMETTSLQTAVHVCPIKTTAGYGPANIQSHLILNICPCPIHFPKYTGGFLQKLWTMFLVLTLHAELECCFSFKITARGFPCWGWVGKDFTGFV